MKTILITGGCGFIGSNFVRLLSTATDYRIVNFDKLTYAGNLENVADISPARLRFVQGDICDRGLVERILAEEKPWGLVNFAAESHVDRSILDSTPFLQTNIGGVQSLLEAVRRVSVERFLHISTDEVYGDKEGKAPSTENAILAPSSPYSASKAAADLLCFSYRRTYGLPILVTRSSNNYGPYQFPEKLIPLMIANALEGKKLPVYGDGLNERDWIFVEDHCRALDRVLEAGRPGEVYNIGYGQPVANLEIIRRLLQLVGRSEDLIEHVDDRPGHDRRYALSTLKIRDELGWTPAVGIDEGLKLTVDWYRGHTEWMSRVRGREYQAYYDRHYTHRDDFLAAL